GGGVGAGAWVWGGPGAGKAVFRGAAVDPAVRSIQTGIRNSSGLVAVTHKKTIVDAEHVIDLHVELVDILRLRGSSFKICRRPRASRNGDKAQKLLREWADPVWGDLFVGEGSASRSVGVSGCRIIDGAGRGAEVALAKRHDGNRRQVALAVDVPAALVVAEEKQFVPDDPAAARASKLVIDGMRHAAGKHIPGLKCRVAMILERAA